MVQETDKVIMNGYAVSVAPTNSHPMFKRLPSSAEINASTLSSHYSDNSSGSSMEDLTLNTSTTLETTVQQQEPVYEEMLMLLVWGPNDRRFGFSVFGGSDEDQPPRINKISFGSPATRSGLLLNDEILEINGVDVSGMSHTDVIAHIHKCKNKMTLKIRRCEDEDMSYDTLDGGREMPIDVDMTTIEVNTSTLDNNEPVEEKVVPPQSGMLKYARTQPARHENVIRESNVPAKYYNEAFELGSDDEECSVRSSNGIPNKFDNEGFEGDADTDQFVQVNSKRRYGNGGDDKNEPKSFPIASFISLLTSMEEKIEGQNARENLDHLKRLYFSDSFISAVKTHNYMSQLQVTKKNDQEAQPVASNSLFLLTEVRLITMEMTDPESMELVSLINQPEIQQLLSAHDRIARREGFDEESELFENYSYGESSNDESEDEPLYKIVRIDKSDEPLGATVMNDGEAVIISRIVRGGAAEKSGALHVGDEIVEINDESVRGKDVNEVVEILMEIDGTITFTMIPAEYPVDEVIRDEDAFVVKALFDYVPETDEMLPCAELGLGFNKGDVLEVLNQTDPDWWQARLLHVDRALVNSINRTLAGLIPSRAYQTQREAAKITLKGEDTEPIIKEKKRCFCGRRKRTAKRVSRKSKRNAPLEEQDVLTYEDMIKFFPDPMRRRPVVLLGPEHIGRVEMKKQLIRTFPETFASAVEHTTRLPSHEELSGIDYIFVSRNEFEKALSASEFIQYGEHEGHYYGVSFKSVRDVIASGKTCLLNLNCTAVVLLRRMTLMPYVIFITVPRINHLKQLRGLMETGEPFNPNVTLKEDKIDALVEEARGMHRSYGHLFDRLVVNHDYDQTYNEVLQIASSLEKDPQWIPAYWLPS